jgi:hypothetical protein
VQLREEAVGRQIRNAPAGETVVGTLATPRGRVVAAEEVIGPSADPLHCEFLARYADSELDCATAAPGARFSGLWLHVVTDDGIDGWVLVRAGIVGL